MHLLVDPSAIEARLLELAHTTDAKLTASALAYFAPCTLDAAERVLDELAARNRVTMHVEDDGTISYELLGRQRLPPRAPVHGVLMPMVEPPTRRASPALAAFLSALIPGAGHLYAGRVVAGLLWFLVVGVGYTLLLPGLVLHLFSMASAAAAAQVGPPPVYPQLGPGFGTR